MPGVVERLRHDPGRRLPPEPVQHPVASPDRSGRGDVRTLQDGPHQLAEMLPRRRPPTVAPVLRDLQDRLRWDGFGGAVDEERVVVVHELEIAAPARADGREARGHGLHVRPAPPLAPGGQHERVGGPVQAQHPVRPEVGVEEVDLGTPGRIPAERLDEEPLEAELVVGQGVPVGRGDLEHELGLTPCELLDERPGQDVPSLAEPPGEDGEERERPATGEGERFGRGPEDVVGDR